VVFLGINDCGTTDSEELDSIVENIFDTLHHLYVRAGARNFVLFDIPPIDRSPQAIDSDSVQVIEDRVKTWNEVLQAQTTEFALSSKEATVMLFSSHQVLLDVLEDPLEYDFSEDDPTNEGGIIWVDDLPLT
ncbi:carbohydrate esterase family 16 protein, partial [Neolentinus lepideus HHB14362 ss-1]